MLLSKLNLRHTVIKEMKCFGDSEILHGLVHDMAHISACFYDFRVVSQTISEYALHLISFLTVHAQATSAASLTGNTRIC